MSAVLRSLALTLVCVSACGPSTPNTPQKAGTVTIGQVAFSIAGMDIVQASHNAAFTSSTSGAGSTGCTQRNSGACSITLCVEGTADAGTSADASVSNPAVSAGVITISGGSGTPVMLTPSADNNYPASTQMSRRWSAGDMVSIAAAGNTAGVPMFSGTLTYPGAVMVTSPVVNPLQPAMIMRSAPLQVRWTGGVAGSKVAAAISQTGNGRTVLVRCNFDAVSGSGDIPVDAMTDLAVTMSGMPATNVLIGSFSESTVTAGEYSVVLNAGETGTAGQAAVQ